MAGSKDLGALYGQIGADTSQWDRAVRGIHADFRRMERAAQRTTKKISRSLGRAGRGMKNVGQSMNRYVTLPLMAAGGAAIKFGSDFEESLAQAQAQADLTGEQVSFIGDSAEDVAVRTGEATSDIIEAYKFTISAGKNLAESQEIVEAAAEASAAGFGEQRDLVRSATTALNAYSERLDSGREFMDLLVGSAQVMELEVSKLSRAMQKNVGVADQLGIGMDELLSGIGAVSEIMGDANRGGRLFSTMMNKLLSPTGKAKEAIEGVFGSLSNLHETIDQDGLLPTMVKLRKELEASSEEGLGLVFSQRSLEAALNLTNNEGARTVEIMENMGDTTGSTAVAFDKSASFSRNLSRAWQALQKAARPIGNVLMEAINPGLEKAIDFMDRMADVLENLNPKVIQVGVAIAAAAAALGPLLTMAGMAVIGLSGLVSAFGTMLSMGSAVVGFFASLSWPVVLGVAGIAAAATAIITKWDEIKEYFQGEGSKFLQPIKKIISTFAETAKRSLERFVIIFQKGWELFGSNLVAIAKGVFSTLINLVGMGLEGLSVVLNIWSGKWLTDWDEFLKETKESFKNVFGEDGYLESIFNSWWERFLQNDPIVNAGNWISDVLGLNGPMQKAADEATNKSQETADEIESIYKDLAESLRSINFSLGLPDVSSIFGGGGGQDQPDTGEPQFSIPSFGTEDALKEAAKNYTGTLDDMKAAGAEFSSVTKAAFASSKDAWQDFIDKSKEAGFDFVSFMTQQVSGAIIGFAETLGKAMAGAGNEFTTAFDEIILVVIDFAKRLGELLVGIGTAMMIVPGLQGSGAGYIAGGAALVALASAGKAMMNKKIESKKEKARQMEQATGGITSVNDALITSGGKVVKFHPNDDILASKELGSLGAPATGSMSSSPQVIEVTGTLEGRGDKLIGVIKEAKYKRNK